MAAKTQAAIKKCGYRGVPTAAARTAKPEASVNMWLADTGCGHDLIQRAELTKLKRWIRRAARPITFITANGRTQAKDVVDLFVKEFGETISPFVLESTPAVVSVGFRCMELGYTFIWPPGRNPYFVTPSGNIIYLEVHDHIPYLKPGSELCRPRKPSGKECFACGATKPFAGCFACGESATPGPEEGDPSGGPEEVPPPPPPPAPEYPDPAEIDTEEEADRVLPKRVRRDLRAEANSLHHLLRHKPSNPYCDACRRGRMRKKS